MEDLVRRRTDLSLRKIEVPRGRSEVASQYNIRGIPHLLLYDRGKLVATGTDAVLRRLQ